MLKKLKNELAQKTAELERFFDINLDLLCIADLEGNFLKVNQAWQEILGYSAVELETRKFLEFVHPDDLEATMQSMEKLANNEQVINFVNRYISSDGTYRYIEWRSQPYQGLIYAAARDITERKETELALLRSQERFDYAMKGTKAGLWDWDMFTNKVFFSQEWKSMLGYKEEEVENDFEGWKKLWHPEDAPRIEKAIDDYLSGKTDIYEIDHRLQHKEGEWRWILTRGEVLRNEKGQPYRWIGTNIDITNLKEAEEKIRYLSFHDQLTGLYNRRFYEAELQRLDTERNLPLSVIMADINGLKLANDAFGHLIGDQLLQRFAEILQRECRSDEIIARIGGDEFVILLPRADSVGAAALVGRLKVAMQGERVGFMDVSASLGWATKSYSYQDLKDIFRKAEDAMYQEKMQESPQRRLKIIEAIYASKAEKQPDGKLVKKT